MDGSLGANLPVQVMLMDESSIHRCASSSTDSWFNILQMRPQRGAVCVLSACVVLRVGLIPLC